MVKRTVGSSVVLRKIRDRTLWRGRGPPERKKRSRNVGAPATWDSLALPFEEKKLDDGDVLELN